MYVDSLEPADPYPKFLKTRSGGGTDEQGPLHSTPLLTRVVVDRGGADSDILMKPGSECSENPVLPGFSEENHA